MTCIVGLETEDGVILGGDSAASGNSHTTSVKNQKVFNIGSQFGVGYTSSFRMGQILKRDFDPRSFDYDGIDDKFNFTIEEVVPMIRKIMKDGGYSKVESNREKGGLFLFAVADELFKIQKDFSVIKPKKYSAIGSGYKQARGSLYSTEHYNPEKRVKIAIRAAAESQDGVSLPLNTIRVES